MTDIITYVKLPWYFYSGIEIRRNVNVESGPVEYKYTGMLKTVMDISTDNKARATLDS